MRIEEVIQEIEQFAPSTLQESYDNAGYQTGNPQQKVMGVLICLDIIEAVIDEAIEIGANLIISHHPLIFRGLKSLTGANYIERCIMKAIQYNITLYSAHTNLDNASEGVNYFIAKKIGLINGKILAPTGEQNGTTVGSGYIGELPQPISENNFLLHIKELFSIPCIKHTALSGKEIKRVALCGGSGSFLISIAMKENADIFLTGDIKYHDYFLTENRIILADFGHYESEQYTKELICEIIQKKSSNFAVQYSKVNTNPINYL